MSRAYTHGGQKGVVPQKGVVFGPKNRKQKKNENAENLKKMATLKPKNHPAFHRRGFNVCSVDSMSDRQKWELGAYLVASKHDMSDAANSLSISKTTLQKYKSKSKKPYIEPIATGRPPVFNERALEFMRNELEKGNKRLGRVRKAFNRSQSLKIYHAGANITFLDRGLAPSSRGKVSHSSWDAWVRLMKLRSSCNLKNGTAAREREMADCRNAFTAAVAIDCRVKGTPHEYRINQDGTQIFAGTGGISNTGLRVRSFSRLSSDKSFNRDVPVTRNAVPEDSNSQSAKIINTVNAAGRVGEQVILHAVGTKLPVDTSVWIHIDKGFKYSFWLTFATTRSPSESYNVELIKRVTIPFIEECRRQGNPNGKPLTAADKDVVIIYDGEDTQMKAFQSAEVREGLAGVVRIKGAASCSAVANALDAGNVHKATRGRHSNLSMAEASHGRESVIQYLTETIKRELIKPGGGPLLSPEETRQIVESTFRVVVAYEETLNAKLIKDGFTKAGLIRNILTEATEDKFDVLKAQMNLMHLKEPLTAEEFESMRKGFPAAVEFWNKHGMLTEDFMDTIHIKKHFDPNDRRKIVKDARAISHQRTLEMSHAEVDDLFTAQQTKSRSQKATAAANKQKKADDAAATAAVAAAADGGIVADAETEPEPEPESQPARKPKRKRDKPVEFIKHKKSARSDREARMAERNNLNN